MSWDTALLVVAASAQRTVEVLHEEMVERRLHVRLLVEALLKGEPRGGQGWRSRFKVPGSMVADANSLFDHLQKTGPVRKERRPVNDLLVIKDMVANLVVKMKLVPRTHILAYIMTKEMHMTNVFNSFSSIDSTSDSNNERTAFSEWCLQKSSDRSSSRVPG